MNEWRLKNQKVFSLLILITIIFLSCKREYKRIPITYVPDELRKSFYFNKGSYWLYQDSLTSNIDSIRCTDVSDDTTENLILSIAFESTLSDLFNFTASKNYSFQMNTYQSLIDSINVSASSAFNFKYPFKIGAVYYSKYDYYTDLVGNHYTDTMRLVTILNSYTFNGINFQNVIIVDVKNENGIEGLYTQYYFAEGIGLIQYKNFSDTTNYKLIDYHLN